ncbi:MAG: hypothetical protein H7210_03910 [Pyrinomonadaceae bacterium]|nr:hypothetical protein [Phycisphaerales bacterium]
MPDRTVCRAVDERWSVGSPCRGLGMASTGEAKRRLGPHSVCVWFSAVLAGGVTLHAEPVDLSLALTDLQTAYRRSVTQERVEVTIRKVSAVEGAVGPGQAWKEQFVVRIDPGRPGQPGQPGRGATKVCLLELGELRVWWSEAGIAGGAGIGATNGDADPPGDLRTRPTLIAVHERDATSCFLASIQGALTPVKLDEAMMPVPAPQLALAFADASSQGVLTHGLTTYTPDITWDSASRDERKSPGDVVIVGRVNPSPLNAGDIAAPGKATLVTDFRTGRLKRFTAEIDAGRLELDVKIKPESPLAREKWGITQTGRRSVSSLADLGPRPGDAAASRVVPEMLLQTLDGLAWDFHDALRTSPPPPSSLPAGAGTAVKNDRLVLLLVRERAAFLPVPAAAPDQLAVRGGSEFVNPDAEAGLAAITAVVKQIAGKSQPKAGPGAAGHVTGDPSMIGLITSRVVLVPTKTDDKTREKVAGGAKVWGDSIVWSASPASTIDRFAPGAEAVIVVVRAPQSLCGVIRLDGRKGEAKAIEQELHEAIGCQEKVEPPGVTPPAGKQD